ncbi:MAG: NAD(P)H-dependent glycerol-3-phosphate dehydrogenase [Sphaerochaetaceae bacterium]
MQKTIIIAGSGVFGTAMAQRLSWNQSNTVIIYCLDKAVADDINRNHRNSKYYPTHILNTSIRAINDKKIFANADDILLIIPSKVIVSFTNEIKDIAPRNCLVINMAKGMSDDGAFITERIPFERTASMKGPSFAIEVLNGLPTAFTFGGRKEDFEQFKNIELKDTSLQLDYTDDIRSVELMSILKNMYAIAIGLVSGKFNSPNVDFLIYTKAVNEMRRFLTLFGCEDETIFKYCGLGDLGLTSLNDLSRNRTMGLLMGKGFSIDQNDPSSTVVEGYRTVKLMGEMTREKGLSGQYPLVQALYRLLYEGESVNTYLTTVLNC